MRNKYRITRGGDGQLLVRPSGTGNRRRWRIGLVVVSVLMLLMATNVIPVSKAFSAVIEMSEYFFKDDSMPASRTIVVKLDLSDENTTSTSALIDREGEATAPLAEPIIVPVEVHDSDMEPSSTQTSLFPQSETTQESHVTASPQLTNTSEVEETSGLVIHEAQVIPEVGESFDFFGFRFEVLRRQRNQITSLRITPPPTVDDALSS